MATTPSSSAPKANEALTLGSWTPRTAPERDAVRQQLERILESPMLANSKRCASLLKVVVECYLEGHADHLKERSLGVDVFQREADYDTNRDPVVRTTAVEIRKRLAQYYTTPAHENELRIALPAGSYVPEVRFPGAVLPADPISPIILDNLPAHRIENRSAVPRVALGIGIVLIGLAAWWILSGTETSLDRFWKPVIRSAGPAVLVIGGSGPADTPVTDAPPVTFKELYDRERVAFADATALARLGGVLMIKGKSFHFRRHETTRLEDLQDGPVILIGAFNNEWSIRLGDHARFRFMRDPDTRLPYIEDRQDPASRRWLVDSSRPFRSVSEDYALVSRFQEPTTGRLVIQAAGITKFGTAAAGEFLSDPAYLEQALKSAPRDWDKKNLQILISTKLVGESSGPPVMVASHFW